MAEQDIRLAGHQQVRGALRDAAAGGSPAAPARPGLVALVGAGPGRADLITVRGLDLLERADVVVHDRLDTAELLARAGVRSAQGHARLVDVGKREGSHPVPQERINELLVEEAVHSSLVVRLKGGDPYVFGRGGEEASALAAAGVPFEVVPGVTSALAALSYAGVPVTDRRRSASFHVLTGHRRGDGELGIDYASLVAAGGTWVFLMAVRTLGEVCQGLLDAGGDPAVPACVVERGTMTEQRRIDGTLASMAARARAVGVRSPAILVVGAVCDLAPALDWYDALPLRGRTVAVTRPRGRAAGLADALRDLGAHVRDVPLIETVPVASDDLVPVMRRLGEYAWLLLSSVEGARCLADALDAAGLDARALAGLRVGAVGPATASELRRIGVRADMVPETFDTVALGRAVVSAARAGERVLLLRARDGSRALPRTLSEAGVPFDDVAAYDTRARAGDDVRELASALLAGRVDAVTLTSPSCARALAAALDRAGGDGGWAWPEACAAVCIGPVTGREAARLGMRVVCAHEATVPSLVVAVREVLG